MEMVAPVCLSIGGISKCHAARHTGLSPGISRFKVLSISGWISSQIAAFPAFIVLTAGKTSTAVMLS